MWQIFSLPPGGCGTVVSCRAGEIPHMWWSQKKAICFSSHYWTAVSYLGNQQQSLMGDRGEEEYFWSCFCICTVECSCFPNTINKHDCKSILQHFRTWHQHLFNKLHAFVWDVTAVFSGFRLCSMIHVEGGQATGTACSGLNTWPLDTTWLQR